MPNPKLETYKNKATDTVYDFTDADAQSKISATVDLLKDTTGWLGGNELPPDIIHLATSGSGIGETTLTTDASATAFVGELKSNTDYVVKAEGGNRFRVALATIAPANGTTVNIIYDNASVKNYSFNSGAYNYIYLLADYQGTGTLETIKPMLLTEEQYNLNPTYRPFHESVEDWYWDNNAKIGVHNNFKFPYRSIGGTDSGGTFIINSDKTITASGTFTGNAEFRVMDYITDNRYEGWIISSNAEFSQDFYIRIREALSDDSFVREIKETNGQIVIPHMDSGHKYFVGCRVGTTGSVINVTLKPTLSVPDDTYKGYTEPTMTNMELTEKNLNYSDNNKSYSSLDDIPVGIGYATLSSGISPTGAELAGEYICFGLGKGSAVRCVAIYRYSAGELYLNHYNGSSWAGWYKFTGTAV